MSDTNWIVDIEVEPDQAETGAATVKRWLIHEGIVLPTPPEPTEIFPVSSPCYPRYLLAPGPKARQWCSWTDEFTIFTGLNIATGKRVFDPGANFCDAIQCPRCGSGFDSEKLNWMAAIDRWWHKSEGTLTCPACNATDHIGKWVFPAGRWAFGYLGFGFEEWPVDERMLEAISTVLQHQCVFVQNHI